MKFKEIKANFKNTIKGGKGDNLNPESVDQKQLIVGVLIEMEHTNNPMIAMEIALDHLEENPKYYTIHIKSGLVDEPEALELAKKLAII